MRNMSFFYTQRQIRDQTKTETRRLGWEFVRVGDLIQPVVKCQGLAKGERIEKIGPPIRVTHRRREPVDAVDRAAVIREGFPDLTPGQFVEMFCRNMHTTPDTTITVVRFKYTKPPKKQKSLPLEP